MSKYDELTENPPKLEVKGEPRQVKLDLVSVMCDNRYRWTFERKTPEHDFELCTHGYAYSNFHMSLRKDDLEWLADDGEWDAIFDAINDGVQVVESIKYR